jgi:hypothetical protein
MKWSWISPFVVIFLFLPIAANAQTAPVGSAAPSSCPLALLQFNPSGVAVRVKNVSGKRIRGLSFYAALSDATEHWKWFHWDFDDTRPLREFGWNKTLKPDATKTLVWNGYLNFEHISGSAFVLTSVLFEDGSDWEEPADSASCKIVRHKGRHRVFLKPIQLPPREP